MLSASGGCCPGGTATGAEQERLEPEAARGTRRHRGGPKAPSLPLVALEGGTLRGESRRAGSLHSRYCSLQTDSVPPNASGGGRSGGAGDRALRRRALGLPRFSPPPRHPIAVLPFVNLSGDKDQEYFSDGLTEEVLNSLAEIEGLQVAARTSAFSFKGQDQ